MVPFYIKKNSGKKLAKRPERLVKKLKRDGLEFGIYADIIKKRRYLMKKVKAFLSLLLVAMIFLMNSSFSYAKDGPDILKSIQLGTQADNYYIGDKLVFDIESTEEISSANIYFYNPVSLNGHEYGSFYIYLTPSGIFLKPLLDIIHRKILDVLSLVYTLVSMSLARFLSIIKAGSLFAIRRMEALLKTTVISYTLIQI